MTKIVENNNKLNLLDEYASPKWRNRLRNADFSVDQRGNAGGTTSHTSYIVDGWIFYHSSNVTTLTASRATGDSVPYSLKMTVTTGQDASIDASQYAFFLHYIEGFDFADALWGTASAKPVWVSGRIKAPTTGVYCIAVRNAANNRSYVFEVSCVAGVWKDFSHEVPGDTSGTWEKTTSRGLRIDLTAASGTTYHTTANSWQAGNFLATSNQANGIATNGNVYEIEAIRVSVDGPIPVEHRPYSENLAHCQRYYETIALVYGTTYNSASIGNFFFKTQKRITPTMSAGGNSAGYTLNGNIYGGYIYLASTASNVVTTLTANAEL